MTAMKPPDRIEQPDQILDDLRKAITRWESARPRSQEETLAAEEITNRMVRLDRWLSNGGYLPRAWRSPWPDSLRPGTQYRLDPIPTKDDKTQPDPASGGQERGGCQPGCIRNDEHLGPDNCVGPEISRIQVQRRTPPEQLRYWSEKMRATEDPLFMLDAARMGLETMAESMDRGHWVFYPEITQGRVYEEGPIASPPHSGEGSFWIEGHESPIHFSKEDLKFSKVLGVEDPIDPVYATLQPENPGPLFDPNGKTGQDAPTHANVRAETAEAAAEAAYRVADTWSDLASLLRAAEGASRTKAEDEAALRADTEPRRPGQTGPPAQVGALLLAISDGLSRAGLKRYSVGNGLVTVEVEGNRWVIELLHESNDAAPCCVGNGCCCGGESPDGTCRCIHRGKRRPGLDSRLQTGMEPRPRANETLKDLQKFTQRDGWYIHTPCKTRVFEIEDGARLGNVARELLQHECPPEDVGNRCT